MQRIATIIIGAGHCGLAMSHCLTRRSVDHVILERGQVANSWRTERWDSLRLLTPNWQSRLPGDDYRGPEPDGYMPVSDLVDRLDHYASSISAPMMTGTEVRSVTRDSDGYRVETSRGRFHCAALVLASGACNIAAVPQVAGAFPAGITHVTPMTYKRPSDLPGGGVLIVGGSATGVQLAREVQRSGRQVALALGDHVRVPRIYRGRDIKWWMDAVGVLDQRIDEVDDPARVRRTPSLQLAGYPDRAMLDVNALRQMGVEIVGRVSGLRDGKVFFSGSLGNVCTLADLKMNRLLDTIDTWARERGLDEALPAPHRFDSSDPGSSPRLELDLAGGEIRSVIWATGYRPDYSWLHVPVLDRKGRLRHDGGIVDAPGLYAMGLPFMRRRKSTLIDGAADDASELADHLVGQFRRRAA